MQQNLSKDGGKWKPLERPSDFITLNIGESIIVRYVDSKKSEVFEDNYFHIVDLNITNGGEPELQRMSGKDLDNWFLNHEDIKPGVVLRITRIEDKKLPNKPQPLHRYKMEMHECERGAT